MSDKITKIKIDGNIYTIDLDRSDTGVRESLVDILKVLQGVETDLPEGLISKNDKIKLDTIWAAFDDSEDSDSIVNKIKEVLKVFENYPEATNLIAKLNNIDETIASLDLAQVGADGSYIKTVKQENGQISATKQAFDTTIPATGNNPSNINAPTTKAVRDAINALDVSSVGSDGGYIKTISETDGKISAARQAFATSVGTDGDDTNAPTTKAVRDAIKALDVSEVGSDGNYIKKVSETDGKVSITKQAFDTTVNSSSTDNNAPTSKAVNTAITNAINALDVSEVGSDGNYIKKVSEADGKVSITKQAFDTSVGSSSTDNNAPTSKAVHNAITGAINALDVSNITTNLGAGKTITALSETDGKISATAENISIASSQINDKTNSYSETGETAVTGKAIKNAIDELTDTLTGSPAASKTLTAFDEVGGKVSATFSDIAIAESQVTNLVTDLSNKADLVDGIIPAAQLPSYVDDVIEFAKQVSGSTWLADALATAEGTRVWNAAAASQIPGGTSSPYYKKFLVNTNGTEVGLIIEAPESGKIYVGMTDTNTYRWSGSNLTEISKSLGLGETSTTAYAGNKGKANATAIAALQDSKLDKVTDSTVNAVYGVVSNGSQYMWNVTSGGNGAIDSGKLVSYHTDGNITVPETPTAATDATSKKYVDGDGTITGIKKFTKTPIIEMGSGNDTSAGITFKGNSGDSASVTLRKQKQLSGTYEITIPAVNGTLVTAETVSQYETEFNGNLRAWGIFSSANYWEEGEETDRPVSGLYFDEGMSPTIMNANRFIDLSGYPSQDDNDITIYWPAKESNDDIELTLPNISGTLALAADVNAKYTKPSGGIPNTDIAPSSTNGQVLSTVNGATVWTNISGTGTVTKVIAGTGLTTTADSSTDGGSIIDYGTLYLTKSGVNEGTYTKLDVDEYGRVTYGEGLSASDIPNLPASKITSGTLPNSRIASASYWNNMINILLNATAGNGHNVKLTIHTFTGGQPVTATGAWDITFYYADGTTSNHTFAIPQTDSPDVVLNKDRVVKFDVDNYNVYYSGTNNRSMSARLLMQDEDQEWSFTETAEDVLNKDGRTNTFYVLSDVEISVGFEIE